MLAQGVQEVMAKMYVGKKVDDTDSAYYQFEDELTHKYLEAYPKALALNQTEYEVEKLRKDQKKRDGEIEELKAQMKQLTTLFETALEDVSGTRIKLDFPIGKKRDQD